MACQRGAHFVAMAIAMTCIVSLIAAANADDMVPSNIVTIQNNFPMSNLTVQCDSDTEEHPHRNVTHIVLPKEAYMFSFDPEVQHRWKCTLSTETTGALCNRVKSGKFIMWKRQIPPMCDRNCPWFAGPDGLLLIRHQGAKPVLVYNWPPHHNAHSC